MTMSATRSNETTRVGSEHEDADLSTSYTGVVIIHGIGDQKRNVTLQEALNTLSYWFNHVAGLDLRPQGIGRVWLSTRLTDDTNPDAPSSRARMQLVAPTSSNDASSDGEDAGTLRLRFREVWWAESFGLPSVGPALEWARVQFHEQMAHVLSPIGVRFGPAQVARKTPARETAQAVTYRPLPTSSAAAVPEEHGARATPGTGPHHRALRTALWVYDLIQYPWKLAQWALLAPLITLLLLLMGVVKLIALIPFLRSPLISGFSAVIDYFVLHWVASMRVYLLDYTRSSAIRQRFEREVTAFLRDDHCTRVVVIAHSMGTVISYEGLCTVLAQPEFHTDPKPLTYICLAQALRRIWLLGRTDPERLRGRLPDHVRWLHFWARYDPVSAGPLTSRSLPRARFDALSPNDTPEAAQQRHDDLCAQLDRCENVDVANRDSVLTDHTSYWENTEQVVGPIALELVAGHPALEEHVRRHLATSEQILLRRWSVAWRALVALGGGVLTAAVLLTLQFYSNVGIGKGVIALVGAIASSDAVQNFLRDNVPLYQQIAAYFTQSNVNGLIQILTDPSLIIPYLLTYYLNAETVATLLTAFVAFPVGVLLTGKLISATSALGFQNTTEEAGRNRSVLAFVAVSLALVVGIAAILFFQPSDAHIVVGSFDPRDLTPVQQLYVWLVGSFRAVLIIALVVGLLDAARNRRWATLLALPAATYLAFVAFAEASAYLAALLALTLVSTAVTLRDSVRASRWGETVALFVIGGVVLLAGWDSLYGTIGVFAYLGIASLLPALIYGLWTAASKTRVPYRLGRVRNGALVLGAAYVLVFGVGVRSNSLLPVVLALVSAGAWGVCLFQVTRRGRWGWLALLVIVTLVVFEVVVQLESSVTADIGDISSGDLLLTLWSLSLLVAAMSYGLWNVQTPADQRRSPLSGQALSRWKGPVSALAGAGALVGVLAAPLLLWTVATPSIQEYALGPEVIGNTSPLEIVTGLDNSLWFTMPENDRIGAISTLGVVTQFSVQDSVGGASGPTGIVLGPDHNLWVTESKGARIEAYDRRGLKVKIVSVIYPDSVPSSITVGPDHNIWFTDPGNGSVGRIRLDASPLQAEEFSLGRNSDPFIITSGPDGRLWFTDFTGDRIGRFDPGDPNGSLQVFSLRQQNSLPYGIAAGSDGAMWFTESGVGRIGRITTSGVIREYTLTNTQSDPSAIIAGPGDAMWFTARAGNYIGRIDRNGRTRVFYIPSPASRPTDLTVGPDGVIWFTETNAGKIARL
jgi:virginiamycin B lyase